MRTAVSVFTHSIGKKVVMAVTGLFLVSFLFVHVSGNLQLFYDDGGVAFNKYTKFMTTNPVIKVLEWVLFAGFIFHIIYAAIITRSNRSARPEGYAYSKGNKASSWFSRNMGITGSIVMVFLVVHLVMFWGKYKFGSGTDQITLQQVYDEAWKVKQDVVTADGTILLEKGGYVDFELMNEIKAAGIADMEVSAISMTEVVKASFSDPLIVIFYVLAMGLLAFHLTHGFQSAFHTLGLVHQKYTPAIKVVGYFVAIVIPIVFALMPIYYFFQTL